jgi:uncharacterized radical SAM superfamily Fe-S cluster-containing enzyme
LGETISLCPECLERIEARKVFEDGNVYMEKYCPAHGPFKTVIWRGPSRQYLDWGSYGTAPVPPPAGLKEVDKGCPFDCGLCSGHRANTCSMIMLVTRRCNIACPVCLAGSDPDPWDEPDLKTIGRMFETVIKITGRPTVQLSGGEPTLRDDLPDIVSMGSRMGFPHMVINSNGIRIAKDAAYVRKLSEAGTGTIYLQFDGLSDRVYRFHRGMDLLESKIQALENCREAGIGVILVPTLIPGHNDDQFGAIIDFAKEWMPTVRGVHFQPVSYFGRYPETPEDEDRITLPEVIKGLVAQTRGELQSEDFLPRRSASSYCSFSGLFVLRKGRLHSTARKPKGTALPVLTPSRRPPWESARSFMELHWQLPEENVPQDQRDRSPLEEACREVETRGLAISCMPFQDVWNVDLDRLDKCCLHVTTPEMKIIPFCAFYLTSLNGKRLYRNRSAYGV